MTDPTPAEARSLLSALTRALASVGMLALAFTAVNVTLFATSRGVDPTIAILLDPMVALALAAILYADARLAAWGIAPPRWSAALRWFTAITATLMNIWDSIWPNAQIRAPIHPDPAGIVLHGVPTVLLILLTETIAAYRRTITPLLNPIGTADPTTAPRPPEEQPDRSNRTSESATPPARLKPLPTHHHEVMVGARPYVADGPPVMAPPAPTGPGDTAGATDAALWAHAQAIDDTVRAATGGPASVWRLRTELRLGPDRAKQIHAQLLQRRPHGAPPPS
ncbi:MULTISPECIES: extensin [unclassified Streptomyces]|uniref:extensin n=1 Tax=unclassified Streptomyces TaxID=2593676 RepID=UPI0037F46C70